MHVLGAHVSDEPGGQTMISVVLATTLGALLAPAGPSRLSSPPTASAAKQLRELASLSPGDALKLCEDL